MEKKAVNLRLNLDKLTKKFSHLREELSKAKEALQGFSIPPSTELGEQIFIVTDHGVVVGSNTMYSNN